MKQLAVSSSSSSSNNLQRNRKRDRVEVSVANSRNFRGKKFYDYFREDIKKVFFKLEGAFCLFFSDF